MKFTVDRSQAEVRQFAGPGEYTVIIASAKDEGLDKLVARLSRADLAIPAARVLVPGLQPYPSDLVTPRLQRVIDRTGGGPGARGGPRLM